MLFIGAAVLTLTTIGLVVVARVAQLAMRRLQLDPEAVLLFFGLAEAPPDELAAMRMSAPRQRRPRAGARSASA